MFLRPLKVPHFVYKSFAAEGTEFPYHINGLGKWKNTPPGEIGNFHGVEFGVSYGTPVHAISNGMIIASSYENKTDHSKGYGLRIRQLISAFGYDSWIVTYGFLSEALVNPGQKVLAGERIAYSGDSGASGGSKLILVMADLSGQFREILFRDL